MSSQPNVMIDTLVDSIKESLSDANMLGFESFAEQTMEFFRAVCLIYVIVYRYCFCNVLKKLDWLESAMDNDVNYVSYYLFFHHYRLKKSTRPIICLFLCFMQVVTTKRKKTYALTLLILFSGVCSINTTLKFICNEKLGNVFYWILFWCVRCICCLCIRFTFDL